MYNDETIKIDFTLPVRVKRVVEELDDSCVGDIKAKDFQFLTARDNLEVFSKAALLEGQITEEQLDILWRKYGLR